MLKGEVALVVRLANFIVASDTPFSTMIVIRANDKEINTNRLLCNIGRSHVFSMESRIAPKVPDTVQSHLIKVKFFSFFPPYKIPEWDRLTTASLDQVKDEMINAQMVFVNLHKMRSNLEVHFKFSIYKT